jgi:hypothetical protein
LPTEVRIFVSSHDVNQITVKKLKTINNSKAEMEFMVEVEVQALVRHKNLMLCFCSYCVGAERLVIVYDYMANLAQTPLPTSMWPVRRRLDWKCCIDVAIGFAEGLVYLHNDVMRHIIYWDMKASNVFLDSDFACSLPT